MEFRFCRFTDKFDECRLFYTSMGFEVVTEWNRGMLDRGIVFKFFGGHLELMVSVSPYEAQPTSAYIYAEVDSITTLIAERKRFVASGGNVSEITDTQWGHHQFIAHDPDGFCIRVFCKIG